MKDEMLIRSMKAIQKALLGVGIVAKRSNYNSREDLRLLRFFEVHRIDTVLDVGANKGEYAETLIEGGFKGKIYSFEALPDLHALLQRRANAFPSQWIIAPRCAISDTKGRAPFHVTKASSSSSLLEPTGTAKEMPNIYTVSETIDVPTETLSDCCKHLGIKSRHIHLKIDIQGAEELALTGAFDILPQIKGMTLEMALHNYYSGQATARTLDERLLRDGYDLWDITPAWRHPETGRLDQVDATYFRQDANTQS